MDKLTPSSDRPANQPVHHTGGHAKHEQGITSLAQTRVPMPSTAKTRAAEHNITLGTTSADLKGLGTQPWMQIPTAHSMMSSRTIEVR